MARRETPSASPQRCSMTLSTSWLRSRSLLTLPLLPLSSCTTRLAEKVATGAITPKAARAAAAIQNTTHTYGVLMYMLCAGLVCAALGVVLVVEGSGKLGIAMIFGGITLAVLAVCFAALLPYELWIAGGAVILGIGAVIWHAEHPAVATKP